MLRICVMMHISVDDMYRLNSESFENNKRYRVNQECLDLQYFLPYNIYIYILNTKQLILSVC